MRVRWRLRVFPRACRSLPRFASRTALALLLPSTLSPAAHEQTPAAAPYTLRVYEDLVQVPTLVMDHLYSSYAGLDASRFLVDLDSGPPFHPQHVRLQGQDPVAFAVLLDVSDKAGLTLAEALPATLRQLSPELLQPQDSLSVFTLDCLLERTVRSLPASLPLLRVGIVNALAAPNLHGTASQPHCGDSRKLWDTVAIVANELRAESARRVLLVVSDGKDRKSINTWEGARHNATFSNVTVVAIRPALDPSSILAAEGDHPFTPGTEDVFSMLCGETGGIAVYGTPRSVGPDLARIVALLRNRYILEFPRPSNSTSGYHTIHISVNDKHAVIRTSGATFPVQDKTRLNDPQTVPSDPTRAPLFGNRKALTQPH